MLLDWMVIDGCIPEAEGRSPSSRGVAPSEISTWTGTENLRKTRRKVNDRFVIGLCHLSVGTECFPSLKCQAVMNGTCYKVLVSCPWLRDDIIDVRC